jgi:integrase
VFTSPNGHPLHGPNLARLLRRDLAAAGLPVVTLHELRHSCASWWLSLGVDIKTVSVLLGHTDPRITGQLYLHVGDEMKRDAARRMQEAMG